MGDMIHFAENSFIAVQMRIVAPVTGLKMSSAPSPLHVGVSRAYLAGT